ncbi:MAG: 5'-methylthioadenosine/adenosylhomocysteine nucleosidase [Sedimentisphaerales bacterium]|nr:5'-methylthioadenosine/adenosylhomocysteine nucleosidase [Sedimentisphaerales bacterium]
MRRRFGAMVFCVWLVFSVGSCAREPANPEPESAPVTAILGAFQKEIALLKDRLESPRQQVIEGMTFVRGKLSGREVAIAWTGVGKVNAAVTTALTIEHFQPAHVIFTGIAGAVDPNLEPGDIVIAARTAHHDMGLLWEGGFTHSGVTNPSVGIENPVFFEADEALLATAERAAKTVTLQPIETVQGRRPPHVVTGVIVTGDSFVASRAKCEELEAVLGADAVEMEGAAVAQVCFQRNVGCLVIRSMSDKADAEAIGDKQMFYDLAAENSSRLVAKIIEELGAQVGPVEPEANTPPTD